MDSDPNVSFATAARVAARIREELVSIDRVVAMLGEALQNDVSVEPPPVVVIHGLGGMVHDFYTGIEKLFGAISPHLNGCFPEGDRWHRDLLHSMTLDLQKIRPPVIRTESEHSLLPFLRFRHLYRNLYGFRLDWKRLKELAESVFGVWNQVKTDFDTFLEYLDALAGEAQV